MPLLSLPCLTFFSGFFLCQNGLRQRDIAFGQNDIGLEAKRYRFGCSAGSKRYRYGFFPVKAISDWTFRMVREVIGGRVLVRLGDGVPERIDLVAGKGGRSEFVRRAVLAALGDGSDPVEVGMSDPALSVRPSGDGEALLKALAGKRMTARELARVLGWAELRVDKAVKCLGDRIVFHGGGVMAVGDADV